jgi:hypothetical protein
MIDASAASHEAAHCAAAALLGVEVLAVDTVRRTLSDGTVVHGETYLRVDHSDARNALLKLGPGLAAMALERKSLDWHPHGGPHTDEARVGLSTVRLGITRDVYERVVQHVREMMSEPEFKAVHRALTDELTESDVLTGSEVDEIVTRALVSIV